jgi:hypothetical protein
MRKWEGYPTHIPVPTQINHKITVQNKINIKKYQDVPENIKKFYLK